ncbi:FtsX-like permease family protein [bacterium]|nr:FtsX-like permease family protein [bacterium]
MTYIWSQFGGIEHVTERISCVGLYGVLSFSVTQGFLEIGIRMALGAEKLHIVRLVIGQGSLLVFIGIGSLGLPGAFVMARLLESFLYGVTPTDPFTYVFVPSVLFFITLLACFIPARRAGKLDPLVALRYE